jgi:glycosyltransferase involved in cell wall biosynthesis
VIALDLTRLLTRAARPAPTGIDRVALAYAEHLLRRGDAAFTASTPWGGLGLVSSQTKAEFVATLGAAWRHGRVRAGGLRLLAHRLRIEAAINGERALHARLRSYGGEGVYLHVSHFGLEAQTRLARIKARGAARFVCLIHDLIPIEHPHYARPGQDARHRRRIAAVAAFADAVIVNSAATGRALQPYLDRAGRAPPVLAAPLGVDPSPHAAIQQGERPFFVCLGTIEPRKNQRLLIELWRRLVAEVGEDAPRLVLIGQRGWGSRGTLAALDRAADLRGSVFVHDHMPDAEVEQLLAGAAALLLPSHAEGFGLPLVEALAQGVPVLCSDLPALRETGGAVAEYLDPRDPSGWLGAIRDYAAAGSPRRAAQLRRLVTWRAPLWQDHFAAVDRLIDALPAARGYAAPDLVVGRLPGPVL